MVTPTNQARQPFVIDHGQNMLSVLIDGKYVPVRCRTLHQIERYGVLMEVNKNKEPDPPTDSTSALLFRNLEVHLDFCEIAMNPVPGKVEFPRDVLREKLDPDQIQILADVWLDRFLRPRVDRDPALAPPPGVR